MSFMREKKQSRQKDAYTIELENIHSDFRIFGESLGFVRGEVKGNTHQLVKIEERLTNMEVDLEFVKSELGIIRHNQITRDEFKFLETRVTRLERKLR
jgi:tetrahydromethanopterin S-methyltransferase subunit G